MEANRAPTHSLGWVQALRGVAAFMVVLCHLRANFIGTEWQTWADTYMLSGAMGVDLFFMVSGFIMVYTTRHAAGSARYAAEFMAKRFSRVWPVYAVVALVALVSMRLFHVEVPSAGSVSAGSVLESLAFLPVDPRKPMYYALPYSIGWTLNFEFYFYVVFGASLLAGRFRWLAFFGWMVVALIGVPLALRGVVSMDPLHDYVMPIGYMDLMANSIIWEFVVGVVIGLLFLTPVRISNRPLGWTLIAASIVFAAWWPLSLHTMLFHGITRWGWPLAVMFATMALVFKHREPKIPSALLWLGSASFSLYLVHYYILVMARTLATAYGFSDAIPTIPFILGEIIVCLLMAEASRRVLENGLSEWMRERLLAFTRSTWKTRARKPQVTN